MKPKLFSKMTAAEKRVAIAKDVVKQILAGAYDMCRGSYVTARTCVAELNQETLTQGGFECQVCAAGAGAISAMRLGNQFSFDGRMMDGGETFHVLLKWFPKKQVYLIEDAFELFNKGGRGKAIAEFYCKYNNSTARALGIFRNIIKNRGTFKP